MFKQVKFGPTATQKHSFADGTILFKSKQELGKFPEKLTEKLVFWAEKTPNKTFIAKRKQDGLWDHLSYSQTLKYVKNIGQFLLDCGVSVERPIMILSENSLEHALLALAALHVGVPFSAIAPAYSLVSNDFGKLRHTLTMMTPKLVFAQNGKVYAGALQLTAELFPDATLLISELPLENIQTILFENIKNIQSGFEVEDAHAKISPETVAKILFTSGSTGLPKGVINTHKMICANLQQITQVFPFMEDEPPVFIDWLPWNHTFGGNHNFGLTLYNNGTLYIDDGKPTPKGIETTVQNLREISPTAYFNVPKGFEELIPYLEKEPELRNKFFSKLNIIFYAGASLAQPVWNKLEELAQETIGKKIPIITGLGCTESGPSAMFANWGGSFSGLLGVPVAGLTVKLRPDGDKLEALYQGPNVTPGYWRQPTATENAFDEEGFYKTGDAVKFVDENYPDKGLIFDGRIAEDFKLSTGTWVNVGVLKAKLVSATAPIVQDAVIVGLDRDFITTILFLNADACRKLANLASNISNQEAFLHAKVREYLFNQLNNFAKTATGSATRIERAIIAIDAPSIDLGEITDKGSLNQRAILKYRTDLVEKLYANVGNDIICIA